MGNEVVWVTLEIPTRWRASTKSSWRGTSKEARLTSSDHDASGVFRVVDTGGLSGSISTEDERGVVLMVKVDDLDATLERAHELGISETREGYRLEGLGAHDASYRVAWFEDPAGNRLALVGSETG